MQFDRLLRVGTSVIALALATFARPIAPELNLVDNLNTNGVIRAADIFNPVVRISSPDPDPDNAGAYSVGSGSVFDKVTKRINNVDHYFLCVLTADHVIAGNPGGDNRIDFMNYFLDDGNGVPPSGPLGGTWSAFVLGRGLEGVNGDCPDIAVLGVEVGLAQYNAVHTPGVVGYNSSDGGRFSLLGYGNTGTRVVDGTGNTLGYVEDDLTYGTKRFLNGTSHQDRLADSDDPDEVVYYYDALFWNVGVTAMGTAWHGDSGGPLFYSNLNRVSANSNDMAYATFIGGVLTGGTFTEIGNRNVAYNGADNWAVDLSNYQGWIREKCRAVPEPASIAALSLGVLVLLRRRRS